MTTRNSEELKDVELWEWKTWLQPPNRMFVEGKLFEAVDSRLVKSTGNPYVHTTYRRIHDQQIELGLIAWMLTHGPVGSCDTSLGTVVYVCGGFSGLYGLSAFKKVEKHGQQ